MVHNKKTNTSKTSMIFQKILKKIHFKPRIFVENVSYETAKTLSKIRIPRKTHIGFALTVHRFWVDSFRTKLYV